MKQLQTFAYGVLVAISCLIFTASAQVAPPAGSYAQSCSGIRSDGKTLKATCGTLAGTKVPASLPLPCNGTIGNNNGMLFCDVPPPGIYSQSCTGTTFDGKILRSNCRTMAGTTLATVASAIATNLNNGFALETIFKDIVRAAPGGQELVKVFDDVTSAPRKFFCGFLGC